MEKTGKDRWNVDPKASRVASQVLLQDKERTDFWKFEDRSGIEEMIEKRRKSSTVEACLDVQLVGHRPSLPVQDLCARGISKLW
jgi:hypothetical protein